MSLDTPSRTPPAGPGPVSAAPGSRALPPVDRWRPRGVTELLDAALDTYRADPPAFLGAVAAIVVPVTVLTAVVGRATGIPGVGDTLLHAVNPDHSIASSDPARARTALALLAALQSLVVRPATLGAVAFLVAAWYTARRTTAASALRLVWRRRWALLGVGAVLTALQMPSILVQLSGSLDVPPNPTPDQVAGAAGTAFFALVLQAAAFFVAVPLTLAVPVVVLEGATAGGALRRSWALVRGSYWRTLWTVVCAGLVVALVTLVVAGAAVVPEVFVGRDGAQAVDALAQTVAAVLALPVELATITLLYFDRRVRREALDIEMLAATL